MKIISAPRTTLPDSVPYNVIVSTENERGAAVRTLFFMGFSSQFKPAHLDALTIGPKTIAHISSCNYPVYMYNISTGEPRRIEHSTSDSIENRSDRPMVWLIASGLEYIRDNIPTPSPLNPDYVDYGNVDERVLWTYQTPNGQVVKTALLNLNPSSAIKRHSQPKEEAFFNLRTGEFHYYAANQPHDLVNNGVFTEVWLALKGYSSIYDELARME